MHKLIELIEKGKPFFEKISRNIYLRAIRDGFIAGMPVILFSSIFILIAYVPNAWGFHWSKDIETFLMTPYSYSMGILAFFVGGTTAKALTDSKNRDLPATNQINFLSTMLASMVGFLLMAAEPAKEGGFLTAFMGTKGLLTAFIAAFVTVNVYKVCVKNNVTIRMPEDVPPNISQVFKDLIPFTVSVVLLYGLELLVKGTLGVTVAESIGTLIAPLFLSCRWLPWNYTYLWCLCLLLVCWYSRSFNCRTSNRCYHLCQYRCQLASYPKWTTCR